ncbi:MAG: ATP-dependent Clp protease ATP-binding subunit [Clostridia bacterium]|nr:ATP-dependent Clp protease ATP-binding subunit [Clostridia bacterium]
MKNRFTQKAEHALETALSVARELGHTYIGSEHLLLALTEETDSVAAKLLLSRGVDSARIRKSITEAAGIGSPSGVSPADMTPRTKKIIETASQESIRCGNGYIGTEHLLLGILRERDSAATRILGAMNVGTADLQNDILNLFNITELPVEAPRAQERERKDSRHPAPLSNTSVLQTYGRDLTALAREGKIDPIIGREAETERLIQTLSRRTKNNPCLIGEPGVGKTAVVEGLARRIVAQNVPESLQNRLIITLDIPAMIAGAKYRGEFEERLKRVMEEVRNNPNIILFVDEIHTIIGAGGAEGAIDAANIIKPALARGEMQLIGATTIAEYRRHIEKDAALERRFQSVLVGEPSEDETCRILQGIREKFEQHHRLKISDEAIDAAVRLSVRYIPDRFLPDKAIDLIDEAAAHQRIRRFTVPPTLRQKEEELRKLSARKEAAVIAQNFELAAAIRDEEEAFRSTFLTEKKAWEETERTETVVTAEHIAEIVTQWTSIPLNRLLAEEGERLLTLEDELGQSVIGQKEAISAVSRAIRRGRAGIKDPHRPIGSFLFIGPSGVGKTELCRALARALFGSSDAMIRLDMSEYMERHSVSKLIGSPPGYIGYDEGGRLTEQIRRRPYAVLLFDEIEKAHPDIFNLLLQVLEEGELTDAQGRRVDFRNTVIILTSNVGSSSPENSRRAGFNAEADLTETDPRTMKALRDTFRPEFLNRIDDVVRFMPLSAEDAASITRLLLDQLCHRAADEGIRLHFDESVIRHLAQVGFSPEFGARPLRRTITRMIEDPLATEILAGNLRSGEKITAVIDYESAPQPQIHYIQEKQASKIETNMDKSKK